MAKVVEHGRRISSLGVDEFDSSTSAAAGVLNGLMEGRTEDNKYVSAIAEICAGC
jgi:hypothetical protein